MRRDIADCRALVTGASGGIGRAIALELARQGARLVVLARREERLRTLSAEVAASGREIECVTGDVADPAARLQCLRRAEERFGGLDALVNNAGIGAIGPFADASPERLRQVFEVNFFALAEMTRQALPLLDGGSKPIVVNLGSVLGHLAMPRSSEYCASKFAVRGLSQALRMELRPRGIDVLLVSPATTESEFLDHLLEERGGAAWRSKRATPAEVVARRTVAAMRRGQRELFPDFNSRIAQWAARLAPGWVERMVSRR